MYDGGIIPSGTSQQFLIKLTSLLLLIPLCSCITIPADDILTAGGGREYRETLGTCSSLWQPAKPRAILPARGLDPTRIDVLVWNLYKGRGENWQRDLKRLTNGRELILLQEAVLEGHLEDLMKEQALHWQHGSAFIDRHRKTGVLTAATTPSLFQCMYRREEPLFRVPKTVLITRYPLMERFTELLVVNVHGINFELDAQGYREQLNRLRLLVEGHRGPVIVAGDFNSWSSTRTQYVMELADSVSLQPLEFGEDQRTKVFGYPLDLVFFRGLKPLDARTIAIDSSDHSPLLVSFSTID